jgi:DNA-directed RNA polymerase subunit beta
MEKETENFSAPVFFSADFEQEMKLVLAPGDLNLSSSDFLPSVPLPVRMAGAMNDPFQKLKREQIQFIALSPLQMISLATSLIPFLEHDDANRALMGSNMQRQAVPIIRPERAIVGTGLESLVVAESGQALESKKSGLVIYCSSERIVLHRLESFPSFKTFQGPLWKKKFNSFEKLILSLSLRPASLCMYAQPKGVTASLCMYAQPEGVREKPVANLLEKRKESGEGDLLKPFFKKQFKSRGAEKIINKGGGTKGLEKFKKTNYQLNRLVYHLDLYERSNQETCLSHRPAAREGDWIQKGDLLADCSASLGGELALGRNLMIAYIPWEGYNFEDAIVASQRLVSEDLFTSIHIEKHDVEISESKRGFDVITQDVPYITRREKRKLDSFGLIKVGQWVDEGDILVGKVASIKPKPLSPHQKLAFDLARLKPSRTKDTSLRVPKGVHGRIIRVEVLETAVLPHTSELISALEEEIFLRKIFKLKEKIYKNQFQALFYFRFFKRKSKSNLPLSKLFQPFKKGESQKNLLNLKKISKSKNGVGGLTAKLLAQRGGRRWSGGEKRNANPFQLFLMHLFHLFHLRWKRKRKWQSKRGGNSGKDFQYSSSKALQNSLLFQSWYSLWFSKKKISNFKRKGRSFLSTLQSKKTEFFLEIYLPFSKLVRLDITKRKKGYVSDFNGNNLSKDEENERVPTKVRIYLAERRKIQVGDKVAGRHGNKGILSVLLGEWDMPYLPDGKPLDMILNPLGVPSRMNVGQVFECLLGLAGDFLNQQYKIPPFDEMYGAEASRSLVYLKLYQARLKSGQHWLFYPTKPGKTRITDGRTGQPFYQFVTVGSAYIIKLVHLVDEKIHARSTGPYSLVTKQPLGGRSKHGGQRLGEMEVWALEGFGAAYTLQEMLTSKSDDVLGRQEVLKAILSKKGSSLGNPEAFKVLVRELQSLCLDIRVSILTGSPMRRKQVDISQVP